MFFELRQYRNFPGKMVEWVRFMEETIIPKQTAVGYAIVGSFVGQGEDADLYVWIRRFESEEHRAACQRAFYDTNEWRDELKPIAQSMNDFSRIAVSRIAPTPQSAIH
jgi:hypothetical protein